MARILIKTAECVLFLIAMLALMSVESECAIVPAIVGGASLLGLLAVVRLEAWCGYGDWE